MIKVCHIVNLITGKSDGVYTHLKMIFQNYDRAKFQHYFIFQGGEKIGKEVSEFGVDVIAFPSLKKKISFKTFIEIYSFIRENKIDIIHTHLIKPYTIAGLVNIFTRKKIIFNYNGLFIANNPYYGFIQKSIYKLLHLMINRLGKIDLVLVPSKKSKELLIQETKLFSEPVVYYNGYSSSQILNKPDENLVNLIKQVKRDNLLMAVVGRLEIQKRIDRALTLFKRVSITQPNLYLMIYGDGKLKSRLQSLCAQLQIESKVNILDFVPELVHYYKYFDILLFTSDWEGMPLSMWEALANRIPIIAPDVGGFKEILEENNCGLIYSPGNLKEAEEKVFQLINDEQLRTTLGNNGKSAIENKYNEKKFISQLEHLYFELVS